MIAIIGAMKVEIELLKSNMNLIRQENISGFDCYIGDINGKKVVLVCCGCGKVNAASCTQMLIDKFNVDYIINTGIAGGLNPDVKVCDIVISRDVTYHDVSKKQMKNLFPFKEYFLGDQKLIDLALKACKSVKDHRLNYHLGRIVTGEYFVSDNNLKQKIIDSYSPYCVEMEGAAIGHVAFINNIPFVVIRAISDNADNEATISYEQFERIAAENSAIIVLNMIKMI